MERLISRRRFLVRGAQATAALALGRGALSCKGADGEAHAQKKDVSKDLRGRVAMARMKVSRLSTSPSPPDLDRLLRAGLTALMAMASPEKAAASLFKPGDVVGVKVNVLAGRGASTRPEVAQAVVRLLLAAGVKKQDIIIFDRRGDELVKAGFALSRQEGPFCLGTDEAGLGYEDDVTVQGSIGGCLSRILTQRITALVNVPVMKDHDLAGVSLGMKNLFGLIHNPNRYHDNGCDPFVADLLSLPQIQGKLRLTVLDALTCQCQGGPAYVPGYTSPLGALMVATDPVALDVMGVRFIEAERARRGLTDLTRAQRPPKHIDTAAARGLGVGSPGSIDFIEV